MASHEETGPQIPHTGAAEQRQIKRHHLIYYLRVYEGMSEKVIGHIVDISPHGLKLIADRPVTEQQEYQLRMRFPGTEKSKDELMFDAVCRWCRPDENPAFYLVGFQISNLPPEEANFIQGLINEFGA
jgi:hypothetical protein